jgi:hypothetical protein
LVNGQIQSQLAFFENRYPVTMIIPARNDITYSIGQPDISALRYFKVITQPWAKLYFNIPDGTIHPPAPVSLQGETIYRNGISYEIGGGQSSQPSHYIVGQELLIGGETTRWQGNIWVTRLTYVKEPANTY